MRRLIALLSVVLAVSLVAACGGETSSRPTNIISADTSGSDTFTDATPDTEPTDTRSPDTAQPDTRQPDTTRPDTRPDTGPTAPSEGTIVLQTSGGGQTGSAQYSATVSFGPPTRGVASNSNHRLVLGPANP